MFAAGDVVTVLNAPLVDDEYGTSDAVADWSAAVETTVPGCAVAPVASTESTTEPGRDTVATSRTVFMPSSAPVTALSRLRIAGRLYEVQGDPNAWHSPFGGRVLGLEVTASRITG